MSNNKSRWYFSKEALINTPSRKCGMDYDKELSNRQQAASLIQDMGRLLNVNQLCINTAIVYMHRFYVFHSFQRFHRNPIAACALFLAAKVEEQPRKLEYVIKVAHKCLNNGQPPLDPKSEAYQEQAQELIVNENIMLQTLGFDIAIEHPHTFVVKCCQLVRASKDLAQTSYFMATNSLHLTTMCLQYRPTVVACVCIHLACKWSNWEIPKSTQGKDWFYYVDADVTQEMLEELTSEFLAILDKCPSRLKRKILSGNANQGTLTNEAITHLTPKEDRKVSPVKTETKSKPVASTSGYNQPSTSKANGQTSSMPIPTFSSNEKSAPSPPAKKLKEEPSRTHYMSHSSQASGQLSNVHNLPSMDVHNTTTDNRQRSQSSKDDKKLSLLENEAKLKERKQGQISNVHNLSNMDVHNTTTDNRQRSQPNKEDRKVSPVKTETKPKPVAPPSGFTQPSTSKANVQSISTPIPSSSLNKKQSPEPPARKIKEEPIRTHSMSHSSQASGQLSNVHNLPSMDVHNTTSDSRQRHQPIKDDKIHSLLESETKGKERKQGQISNVHNLSSMDVHNTIPENRQRYQSLKEERKVSPVKTEAKSKPIAPSSFNQASTSKANGQSISTSIPSFSLNKKQSPSPPPIKRKEEPIRTHYMSHSSQASGQISNAHNLPSMDEKKLKEESIRTHYISHTSQPTGQLPTLHNIASMDDRRLKEESIRTNYMSHTSQPPGQPPNLHNLSSMDVHNTPTDNRQPSQSIKDDKILSHLNSEFKEPEENDDSLDEKSKSKDKHHHRHHRHHKNQHHHRHHEHKKHHKDKHKSKHKHKDRDRERHRNDHEEVNHRDKDFKLTLTVPKEEKSEEEIERPSPIKLKISKKQINYSGSESELNSEPSIPPSSLRVVISKERLGGNSNLSNHTMTRSDNVNLPSTSSSRKRKNSPKDELSFQERDLKVKKEKLSD